jgi:hypothetical protein
VAVGLPRAPGSRICCLSAAAAQALGLSRAALYRKAF